jgi:hypothetical protein
MRSSLVTAKPDRAFRWTERVEVGFITGLGAASDATMRTVAAGGDTEAIARGLGARADG